jgi:hypothetical protein
MMMAVAIIAVGLGCLFQIQKIRRLQASYREKASEYAFLEALEKGTRAQHLGKAKALMDAMQELKLSAHAESNRDHFVFPQFSDPPSNHGLYKKCLEEGRESLVLADKALVNAQSFSTLRHRYEKAGTCLWLPFWPNPLESR